jgi:Fe-S cluster assembly ATP-binding protein
MNRTANENMLLQIKGLRASIAGKQVLKGVDLQVRPGEVHAIMGPNGTGKSTLAAVLAGKAGYEVEADVAQLAGVDLLGLEPEARAHLGLFLGFQYPVELPGVNNTYLLRAAVNARHRALGEPEVDAYDFLQTIKAKARELGFDEALLARNVNEGFSGGERKRNEILQLAVLEPRLAAARLCRGRPCACHGGRTHRGVRGHGPGGPARGAGLRVGRRRAAGPGGVKR